VGDAGETLHAGFFDLGLQFGDAGRAARALQFAVHVQGNAARIVAAVFQALEAFDQNGGDITLRNCSDDTAHGETS
jgi:hypothetical protein